MLMPPLIRKIEPGDVIGRCRTIRELGRGGVGTVYLATHQTLQIEVALKVLSPSLSMDNPALAERFIREAQLAARIRHPNVIAVMDAAHDEATGLYYIVMEYVGGGSLSWHLRNGPLPEAKALAIVTGIAHALVIAEENRIVHRDIKPDNIMLDLRGTAKLADLGLAKHAIDSRTQPDHRRQLHGHARLHESRAGARREGRRYARRYLQPRRELLRMPHRRAAVPGRNALQHHERAADQALAEAPRICVPKFPAPPT